MKNRFFKNISVDDIKIKRKLILLYIISVLIPVMTTNLIFYNNVSKSVRNQQNISLEEALKRVKINVANSLDNCIGISDMLYTNNKLNILLNNNYKSQDDYFYAYDNDLKYYLSNYESLYKQIYELNIYLTNTSIVSGGGYYVIDDNIKQEAWYKKTNLTDRNISVDASYDYNYSQATLKTPVKHFSIIRKLDNFIYGSVVKKLLKIDIDNNLINRIIKDESLDEDIFIVDNNNNIVFSNNDEYSDFSKNFIKINAYKEKANAIEVSDNMTGIFSGYKAIIVAPKTVVMNAVMRSEAYIIILTTINLVLPSIIILIISKSLKNRLEMLSKHMKNIKEEKFNLVCCREGKDEIGELIGEFNKMSLQMNDLLMDIYKSDIQKKNLEIARKQAELNALQSQINPHFLFNTLETIRMRSLLKKEGETAQIIKNLSKMLRRSLNWGNDLVSISEELDFTEDFLKIQMYRFEDKLRYNIYVSDEVRNCKIPKLSIMTLVENACIHGIENIARVGTVQIHIEGLRDKIRILIKDDGIGISEEKINSIIHHLKNQKTENLNDTSKSVGMKNVYMRLEMFYGDKFSFYMKSKENEGTEVEIGIPYDILK